MSGSLQIKGNYYYIVHPYKNINNETKYNWVATKCHIKDGKCYLAHCLCKANFISTVPK